MCLDVVVTTPRAAKTARPNNVLTIRFIDALLLLLLLMKPSTNVLAGADELTPRAQGLTSSALAGVFRANRSDFHRHPCRSRQCPLCRDGAHRADRSLADDLGHRCSPSGCQHQLLGFRTVVPWFASVRRC